MLKKPPYHPPNPGAPRRAFSHAAFSHRSDPQRGGGVSRKWETLEGLFRSPRPIAESKRLTRSAVCTSSVLHSLRPCWMAFLSILRVRGVGPGGSPHAPEIRPASCHRHSDATPPSPRGRQSHPRESQRGRTIVRRGFLHPHRNPANASALGTPDRPDRCVEDSEPQIERYTPPGPVLPPRSRERPPVQYFRRFP